MEILKSFLTGAAALAIVWTIVATIAHLSHSEIIAEVILGVIVCTIFGAMLRASDGNTTGGR